MSKEKVTDAKWQQHAAVHPIYGLGPSKPTKFGNAEISRQDCMVTYSSDLIRIFPATALPASDSFQGNTHVIRSYYVDQLIRCCGCERYFIYFAYEHKYRVEKLDKNFQAIPNHCFDCRKLYGELKKAKRNFEDLLHQLKAFDRKRDKDGVFSSEQWLELGKMFLFLQENRQLPDSATHRKLRARMQNLAKNYIPELSDVARKFAEKSE